MIINKQLKHNLKQLLQEITQEIINCKNLSKTLKLEAKKEAIELLLE